MAIVFRPPPPLAARPKTTLSIRARLVALALIAVVPLMIDRGRSIEAHRAERIAAVAEDAKALVRQGVDAQDETVLTVKSVVQVVARAQATLASSAESCTRFLSGAMSDAPWITSLSIIGSDARVACSTAPGSIGANLSDRPYYQEALRLKGFVVGAEAIGRSRGGVGLIAAVPILGDSGAVTGAITAGFDLQWIERISAETARRPGAMMLVIDQAATVLAAYPGQDRFLRKRIDANPLARELRARDDGMVTAPGPDGVSRMFAFARLPNTNAYLAAGLDEAELLRRVDREMRMAYFQFVLIGVIVLLGVWFGGEHMIVRPLRALARMATHIGHGNLQVRATWRSWATEFAPLAGALDAMALRLSVREDELRVLNTHLEELARRDGLSGLANRRGFDVALETQWQACRKAEQPLALIMIDVDHFKRFNDHYGHVAGDACLRAVGEALAKAAKDATIVARYGGEEFALLFANADLDRALRIGEGLRAAIESRALPHVAAPAGYVTVSVGVAALRVSGGESPRDLIEAADAALYAAKRRGRNAVAGHGPVQLLAARA